MFLQEKPLEALTLGGGTFIKKLEVNERGSRVLAGGDVAVELLEFARWCGDRYGFIGCAEGLFPEVAALRASQRAIQIVRKRSSKEPEEGERVERMIQDNRLRELFDGAVSAKL